MIGDRLAHYEISREIGRGGMGVVYEAQDTRLGRQVALKTLPGDLASDPVWLQRFEREARTVARLNHPNIVTVYSVEESEGTHFITMEYVEGQTLSELIGSGPIELDRLTRIGSSLADAMGAAHRQGVTHRDLKPGNVMLTQEGRVKVLDFGLAKTNADAQQADSGESGRAPLTKTGAVVGTGPYMSPEQLDGGDVDYRSDIFSFGVILYEMATGARPFGGRSFVQVATSILRDDPEPVSSVRTDVPGQLSELIATCLRKDPDTRIQSAEEISAVLQGTLLQGPAHGRSTRPGFAPRRAAIALATVALVTGAVVVSNTIGGSNASRQAPPPAPERERLAVLPFENQSGRPESDWLRTGLAEMLTTDLAQSPEAQVLSSAQVHTAVEASGTPNGAPRSTETIQLIAAASGASVILLGSFAQAGDNFRVSVEAHDPSSGTILASAAANGIGEGSVFGLIDQVSDAVQRDLGLLTETARAFSRNVQEVTTASVEAYRYYSEALVMQRQVKLDEAVTLLERAVELDPTFASAFTALARIHQARGEQGLRAAYIQQAIAQVDRLPAQERYYIEGNYYGATWSTYSRGIAAFEQLTDDFAEHPSARYELGNLYAYQDRYAEAIEQFEIAYDGSPGAVAAAMAHSLANMYGVVGREGDGRAVLEQQIRLDRELWVGHLTLSWNLTNWGQYDDAWLALSQAERLRPGDPYLEHSRWRTAVVVGDPALADSSVARLLRSDQPYWRWQGQLREGLNLLARGADELGVRALQSAADGFPVRAGYGAAARTRLADALLILDRPAEALEAAEAARVDAPTQWPGFEALAHVARAREALGERAAADSILSELELRAAEASNVVETRLGHYVAGEIALQRGDVAEAMERLEAASELLPLRGFQWHAFRLPDHVPIWFALGRGSEALGDSDEAIRWYTLIVESTGERMDYPLRYNRSLLRLVDLHAVRGNEAAAARFRELATGGI